MQSGGETLPTGVVTFLLTDVESSTSLWEQNAAAMSRALQLHDETIGAAVTAAGGKVLKARGEGDSTFSVFTRPTEAVRAALAARRALERQSWPEGTRLEVRFAIHMGEVEARDGDYYGTAVNRAARIRSLAVGGQILVSQAVAEVIVDHLPDDSSLVELGEQQLRGLSRPERIRALVDAARPVREAIGGLCPYKGLLAFQSDDDDIFFGREPQIADLLGRLLKRHFVVVVGASGSGKSSLVRAGVVAALRRGEVPGSASWSLVIMTPGENPALRLATELAQFERDAPPVLIVAVDQMEEMFTACRDPLERERFVDALLDAVMTGDGSVMVVGAVRADFYGHCSTISRLAVALSDATVLLGPMAERELRRAIESPAEVAGLRLEPGLVDVMLRDLAREPGSLPLLSHALLETWRRRTGRTLSFAGYRDAGGVRGAIAHTAEAVWNETLSENERPVARRIFLRLTELGEGTEDTRRRVAHDELASGANVDEVDVVLRLLADRRLITVDDGTVDVAHEALIREWPRLRTWLDDDREGLRTHRHLTHAAEDWNALGRDSGELYRGPRLTALHDWLERDKTAQLNDLESAFVEASDALERAGVVAEQERIAARERANRRLRTLLVATAIALVVALVTGVVAVAQRSRADRQARTARAVSISAEVDRAVAEVPQLLDRDRSLALLLAVQAQRIRPDAATKSALLSTLLGEPRLRFTLSGGHGGYAWLSAFPDGKRLAALGRESADIWDLAAHKLIRSVAVSAPAGISVSPDGTLIATGSATTVAFWDAATLRPVGERLDTGAPVTDVAFLPGGKRLAVAVGSVESTEAITPATTAQVWDVGTRRRSGLVLGGHARSVNTFAVSRDARLLAAGDNDGRVVFYNPSSGVPVGEPVQVDPNEGIYSLAFSPDAHWLSAGTFGRSGVGHGYAFDVAARRQVARVGTSTLVTVSFTGDGKNLITGGETVDLWDTKTWQRVTTEPILTQHGPAQISSTPESEVVLSGFDGTLTIWDPNGLPAIAHILADTPPAGGTFSPDGTLLAVSSNDDTMVLYDMKALRPIRRLSIRGAGARGVLDGATPAAFSPDSRFVAIGDRFGSVRTFETGSQRATGPPIATDANAVVGLTFSPDGRSLVAASTSADVNGARVIDVATRRVRALDPALPHALAATFRPDGKELVVTVGFGGAWRFPISDGVIGLGTTLTAPGSALPNTAAFSPDGKLLAIGRTDGTLSFLDAATSKSVGTSVPISDGLLATISWSKNGQLVAVQDVKADNSLVDVAQRARIGKTFPGVAPGLFGVSGFSPDGRTMVLPGSRGTTIWNLDVAAWPAKACTLAGRDLTQIEWNTYFSSTGAYRSTCAPQSSTSRGK